MALPHRESPDVTQLDPLLDGTAQGWCWLRGPHNMGISTEWLGLPYRMVAGVLD